jgi:hypothetical protein
LVLTSGFAVSDQDRRHQYGDGVEKDRHDLLFGEVALRGTAARNTWVGGLPPSPMLTGPTAYLALLIPMWCRA